MKEQGLVWSRIGLSLLGNALYFAGCGMVTFAVFGFEQGAIVGALSGWLRPEDVQPLVFNSPLVFTGLFGAGIGSLIGAAAALPLFTIVGVLRGAAPLDSQPDELFRACATARRAAIICGLAGALSGPLFSFLTQVPLWVAWPWAASKSAPGELLFGGALSGLISGNVVGLWIGALCPDSVDNLAERHRLWRLLRKAP